ncbi:MAG: hypothetical protein HUK08_01775 [Bacteroidaceae bacterium]|nr:hypothetical protein [Bacteroidaceae bacterium]
MFHQLPPPLGGRGAIAPSGSSVLFRFILFLLLTLHLQVAVASTPDSLVLAMKEELSYNMEQLSKNPVPAYFLSLRMEDEQECNIQSSFGASTVMPVHQRTITPMVRVGDKNLDNYKYVLQGMGNSYNRNARGVQVPLDGNPVSACRQAIWAETCERYKTALARYEEAKSKSKTETEYEDKSPCFADAPVEHHYEPQLQPLHIDTRKWETLLNRVTTVFKETRDIESGTAFIVFTTRRTYIVNTDGTEVVTNKRYIRLMLNASINASDGMACPLYESFFAFTEDELPTEAVLMEKANGLVDRLLKLRDAPIADPYAGPAILSSEASGVFFHEIFGHRLESHRMKSGGQTLKKMVGEKVLPATFNVFCDPTLRYYGKQPMHGHYLYDEEGVRAQRVHNVENGVLRNFLMGRIPIDGFPQSNGHGRASGGNDPLSRQSNLIIETSRPYSDAELRQMLIQEARRQGKDYGYFFRSVTGGYTMTEGLNSFDVQPLEVYRVFTDGRKDELVRGVSLIGTPLAMLSNIEAAGDTPSTFIGVCGAESGNVPVTASSPMLYVSKIETQRMSLNKSIPHILPLPEYSNVSGKEGEDEKNIIFRAMNDEMARAKTQLKLEGQPLPYLIDYRMVRGSVLDISGQLGGVLNIYYMPRFSNICTNVVLGDKNMTSLRNTSDIGQGQGLPSQLDYDNLRRSLWISSENMYKTAINEYAKKMAKKKQTIMPEDDINIPERIEGKTLTHIEESVIQNPVDTASLKNMVSHLSAVFTAYPKIYDAKVNLRLLNTDFYRNTSEGLQLRTPNQTVYINVHAKIRTYEGSIMEDELRIVAKNFAELPPLEDMERDVREFADLMLKKANAPVVKEYYVGPIMMEDEAVNEAVMRNVVKPFCHAERDFFRGSSMSSVMLGKRIVDNRLSVTQLSGIDNYNGIMLAARQTVDCDGIAQTASLPIIKDGILRNLLCGSFPAVGATASTGNAGFINMGMSSQVIPTITRTTFDKPVPMPKMKSILIQEAKKAGLDHAYIVKAPRNAWRYLVRLDINTGKEEIVRTEHIPQPTRNDLMHVIAASQQEFVANKFDQVILGIISTITPKAIIVESIEFNFTKPQRVKKEPLANPMLRK